MNVVRSMHITWYLAQINVIANIHCEPPTFTKLSLPLCLGATAGGDDSKNIHTVKSVQDLMKMLSDIGNWETLCTLLGVNQGVMSELKFTSLDTNIKKKRCLESYFDSGHAHWEEVIKAVVGPGILNARVAKEIAYKYLLDHRDILSKHEL